MVQCSYPCTVLFSGALPPPLEALLQQYLQALTEYEESAPLSPPSGGGLGVLFGAELKIEIVNALLQALGVPVEPRAERIQAIYLACLHNNFDMPGRRQPARALENSRARARDDHACRKCGTRERTVIDHVRPFSRGGLTTFQNLQVLCVSCNSRKRDRVEDNDAAGVVS